MNTTQIKSLYADFSSFDGKTVAICGWERTIRDSKNFGFIELNDGSFSRTFRLFSSVKNLETTTKSHARTSVRRCASKAFSS